MHNSSPPPPPPPSHVLVIHGGAGNVADPVQLHLYRSSLSVALQAASLLF